MRRPSLAFCINPTITVSIADDKCPLGLTTPPLQPSTASRLFRGGLVRA